MIVVLCGLMVVVIVVSRGLLLGGWQGRRCFGELFCICGSAERPYGTDSRLFGALGSLQHVHLKHVYGNHYRARVGVSPHGQASTTHSSAKRHFPRGPSLPA